MAGGTPLSLILAGKAGGGGGGSENAVLYTAQTLTAAQKSQARDNIGATDALTSIPDDVKQALLNCFSHVAWTDANGQSYYNELSAALYLGPLQSISAVFTQGGNAIYDTDSLDVLRQYLVVTAHYAIAGDVVVTGYDLSGTLTSGTSTITANYGGRTATFSVTVTNGTIYSLENYAFSNERIVPGVIPFKTEDTDISIALDITLATKPSSGDGSAPKLISLSNESGNNYSIGFIQNSSTDTAYRVVWTSAYLNLGSTGTGRTRVVLTHAMSSDKLVAYQRKDTGNVTTAEVSATFETTTKQFSLGQGTSGAGVLPTGTINKAYFYNYVLSDYAISKFLGVEGE